MEKKRFSLTKNQTIAAVMAVGIIGAAIYMHSLGTKVSYYEVKTGAIEKLENVKAKALPVNPSVLALGQDGILLTNLPDVGTAVDQGQVLTTFKALSLKSRIDANAAEWLKLSEALKLTDANADAGSKLVESFKEWQLEQTALNERFKGHDSVLELLKTGMVAGKNYAETLDLLNDAVNRYLDKTIVFRNTLEEISDKTGQSVAFDAAASHLEALQQSRILMNNSSDGKSTELSDLEGQTKIVASQKGVVTRTFGRSGMYLPIGTPVIEVADTDKVMLSFDVPVTNLDLLKLGTSVRMKDSSGKVVIGKITWIGNQITDQMSSDGSIQKYVSAKATFTQVEKIKLYEDASISIVLDRAEKGLIVPVDLLTERDGKYFIRYNDAGVLKEREVKVDFKVEDLAVLSSGVKAGDKIVVDTSLNPGQHISFK